MTIKKKVIDPNFPLHCLFYVRYFKNVTFTFTYSITINYWVIINRASLYFKYSVLLYIFEYEKCIHM